MALCLMIILRCTSSSIPCTLRDKNDRFAFYFSFFYFYFFLSRNLLLAAFLALILARYLLFELILSLIRIHNIYMRLMRNVRIVFFCRAVSPLKGIRREKIFNTLYDLILRDYDFRTIFFEIDGALSGC